MPLSADPVRPYRPLRLSGGVVIALAVAGLIALLLASIALAARDQPATAASHIDLWFLLRTSAVQASLTTVLSLLVGIALAWALNRLRFPGRGLVVGFFASAIVAPGIVVAFGLLSVWGRSGWIASLLESLFGVAPQFPIFGLGGIVLAHVTLDGAFAARVLLGRLDAIPQSRLKTGQSLALGAAQRFSLIDWPALRGSLPGLSAIIFLIAFTSFPIVLLLGGGPANQTLEVAIYSAVRLDFDLNGAVLLALVQIIICSAIILASASFGPLPVSFSTTSVVNWRDGVGAWTLQVSVLVFCLAGFALPLLASLLGGINADLPAILMRPALWTATLTSVAIASCAAILALALALAIGMARAATLRKGLGLAVSLPAYAYLATPAVVLALGFFLLVRTLGGTPEVAAPFVVILANALLALPFSVATLGPPLEAIAKSRGRLIRSLGLSDSQQFFVVEWPLLGRDIGFVLALAFCFSLGDFGVIALFGTENFTTLPLLMLRALGAYRSSDAAAIVALLLVFTFVAFTALPALIGRLADATTR